MCVGAALPAGYAADAVASADADCNDADVTRWLTVSYAGRDRDSDEHPVAEPGELCQGAAALPAGYSASAPPELRDCDDGDVTRWRLISVYRDADGDGVGAGPRTVACLGRDPAAGFSLKGYDPNDDASDPDASLVSNFDLPPDFRTPPEEADDEDIFP